MGLRPTNTNEGAIGRCRGINNLDRAFNRVFSARIPEPVKHPPQTRRRAGGIPSFLPAGHLKVPVRIYSKRRRRILFSLLLS